jgi:hypothetical protein
MLSGDLERVRQRAVAKIRDDADSVEEYLRKYASTPVGQFILLFLSWALDTRKHQLLWEMFHEITRLDERYMLADLNSFVGNALLDDSYFVIVWVVPDYAMRTLGEGDDAMDLPELQFVNGDIKVREVPADDPRGRPRVRYTQDNGSQDPVLLLAAMETVRQRDNAQIAEIEAMLAEKD